MADTLVAEASNHTSPYLESHQPTLEPYKRALVVGSSHNAKEDSGLDGSLDLRKSSQESSRTNSPKSRATHQSLLRMKRRLQCLQTEGSPLIIPNPLMSYRKLERYLRSTSHSLPLRHLVFKMGWSYSLRYLCQTNTLNGTKPDTPLSTPQRKV